MAGIHSASTFSLADAPVVLVIGLLAGEWGGYRGGLAGATSATFVGWSAIAVGLIGVVLHLDSRFFNDRTIKSLIYAASVRRPAGLYGPGTPAGDGPDGRVRPRRSGRVGYCC